MRVQKIREEAIEKERDAYFNDIWSVIPMKQELRVKEKINTPVPTISDDDDEAPLIKDESPPPTSMDTNIVFTLPAEFRGAE
jgi:hypothetical protein